ncbi:MAG: hypothetical protein IPJ94_22965 [Chloroflexi bacterium]|nr:hypothetical protein [Chloroflexota bacterium]
MRTDDSCDDPSMIFTFYSYKGGVGRSMALANVAEFFYQNGLNVLIVDWDLEAPGLERFFPVNHQEVLRRDGVIDMLLDYKERMTKKLELDEKGEFPFLKPTSDLTIDLHPHPEKKTEDCSLRLLTAGNRSTAEFVNYAHAVITFDWQDFYENWKGEQYFEWLRQQLIAAADIVLIDSRTGVTEMGGGCTYQLADVVVMFCGTNDQNLNGTREMAERFTHESVGEARGGRPLQVIIVPSRVEKFGAADSFNDFQEKFKEFDESEKTFPLLVKDALVTGTLLEGVTGSLWDLMIPYIPAFSFKESVIMVGPDADGLAKDLIIPYRRLAKSMASLSTKQFLKELFPELIGRGDNEVARQQVKIRAALRRGFFEDAEKLLDDVRLHVSNKEQLDSIEKEITKARQEKLGRLSNLIQQSLKEGESSNDLDNIQQWIDEYESLAPTRSEHIQGWRRQTYDLQRTLEMEDRVQEARNKCYKLWIEGGIPNAQKGLELARELEERFGSHQLTKQLIIDAEREYEEERQFAGMTQSAIIAGQFEAVISDYERLLAQGTMYVPAIELELDEDGQIIFSQEGGSDFLQIDLLGEGVQKITQAIADLKLMARDYAGQRANKRLLTADEILAQSPDEAKKMLMEAQRFYGLPPDAAQKISDYLQSIVEPAVQRRREAEKLLYEVFSLTDVVDGWTLIQKAVEIDSHVPRVAEVREQLRPHFEQWVQQELMRIRREQAAIPRAYLGQKEYQQQYRQLVNLANQLAGWSSQDPLLQRLTTEIETFVNQSREMLDTHAYVSSQTRAIQAYIEQRNFRLANEILARLQERIGETQLRDYYPDLPGIQTQLDMRNRIDALVNNLQTDLGADDSRLEQSIYTLQSALKDAPDHPDIPPLLRRLRSRLAFRQGQKAYEEERYIEARRELEKVDSDDKSEAQTLLRQLEAAEKERDELARDIDRISKAKEAKHWRSAYELASHWIGQPVYGSSLENQLAQLHKDIVEEWHTDATRNLETLSRQRPLDEARIKEYLRVFDTLNYHEKLAEWQRKALAPCHQQAAQTAQQNGDLEECVRQWREALRLDRDNDAYEEGLAQARKALLAQQTTAAPADWEAVVRLYVKLQQEYPEDVEIRLRLAEIYLHQQNFGAALSQLRWIDALDAQRDVKMPAPVIAEKARLREQLEQAQAILQRREEIKAYLQISRDVNDYENAQRLYQKLLQDYPGANADNREWWEKSLARLAGELEKDWQQAVSDWEGLQATGQVVVILRKILTLQPGNTKAKQHLLKVANQAGDLGNEVDRFIGAPLGKATTSAAPLTALENWIEQAQSLQEQVAACLDALSSKQAGEIVDGKQKHEQLQERQIDLLRHIQTLGTLRDLLQQGYVRLEKGQRSGQWAEVETITNRLQQEFGDHPVVYAFMRELGQTKRTRQEIDRKSEALKRAVQENRWRESQRLLAELRELDGDGRYLVMDSLIFKTDFAERPLSFSELEKRLADHLNRISTLYQWLSPLLQTAPWRSPALPIANLLPDDLRSLTHLLSEWLSAPEDKPSTVGRFILFTIREQRDKGDFSAAQALCRDALGNYAQKQNDNGRI